MKQRVLTLAILLTSLGFGLASCETPYDMPVESGKASYGTIANSDLSTYYYPHRAGVVYVYSNKLTVLNNTNPTYYTGSNDTVRTLGHQGFTSTSDSVFAISVTYKVASDLSGRSVAALRYLPATSTFAGAYVNSTSSLNGEQNTSSLATRAVSTDSLTAPCYGRIRSFASDLGGSSSSLWQTDTVYFTSNANHVALWAKNSTGSFVKSKDLFSSQTQPSTGAEWSYSTWQSNTKVSVLNDNANISVGSTSMSAIQTSLSNTNLAVPIVEQRFFAPGYGPVRQISSWWTTTDGVNRIKNTSTREGVVVIDRDEILTL